MRTILIRINFIGLLLLANAIQAQDRFGSYFGISVHREFEVTANYSPYIGQTTVKLGPLFLQGDIHYSQGKTMNVNYLEPTTSYGGRIGYLGGKSDEGISGVGFTLGYQHLTNYRKIHFDEQTFPVDVNGHDLEIEKVNIRTSSDQFSIGLSGLIVSPNKTGNFEAMIDDYDLEMNKNKKRNSVTFFSLEMLYSPKIEFSNTFAYNPWGYFVDRQATITAPLKQRKFGVRFVASYAPYTYMGFNLEMGIYPGLKHSTENFNDFGLGVKIGFFVNFAVFSK